MGREGPLADLRPILERVEKPGRYAGGEFGAVAKECAALRVAVSYPDLYEIGMSNAAVRILYNRLNALDGVACERVFAPAPDLEAALRAAGVPLFSLETRRPLASFDVLAFSVGYELTLTNLLAILDTGGVPLLAAGRSGSDPVVLAGGPAATNPVPWGLFADCVFIGEAEGWIGEAFAELARMKVRGAGRDDILAFLRGQPSVWHPGKSGVRRALWRGFSALPERAAFPVPSMRVVQDHGTVEIMRGCPHACRFCHASVLYRPCRQKLPDAIRAEVHALVHGAGYRQVTLSSLSSGDYRGLHGLVRDLNSRYAPLKVSFSLPSLHVDSLALQILEEISEVRKSGLTFAVETALPEWQQAVRKTATVEKVVEIMREAKSQGWRGAKFYFMVGLPASFCEDEATPIMEFLRAVRARTGMSLNVNVASFIPKPHTPYERAAQLGEDQALARIMAVVKGLKPDGIKVGYHAPILSLLEGIICRGDERAGRLALDAYRRGARLDAWEEHFRGELWRAAIAEAGWDVLAEACRPRSHGEPLPWAGIGLGLSCSEVSDAPQDAAGGRGEGTGTDPVAVPAPTTAPRGTGDAHAELPAGQRPPGPRLLFSFSKTSAAVYISHLDMMGVFERALIRAGVRARFTEGFNPKPRLEFASPLGLGIESEEEVAAVVLEDPADGEAFVERMNRALPGGLRVARAELTREEPGVRRRSLMSLQWGSEYRVAGRAVVLPLGGGRSIRAEAEAAGPAAGPILRTRTLARGPDGEPASYFDVLCAPPPPRSSDLS